MPVTSKHLRGVTELSLIANIKPGLVDIADPTAYSARLRAVLGLLFSLRQSAVEREVVVADTGPLERLRVLHFFNGSLIDRDQRLLLTVVFDGPWEAYVRALVDRAGPLLDIIFCHCEGYAGNSCLDGHGRFSAWVRDHQINSDFLYVSNPDLTVDDLRYLQGFERESTQRSNPNGVAPAWYEPAEPSEHASPNPARFAEVLGAMARLRHLFPGDGRKTSANDTFIFDRAAELLTRHLRPRALGVDFPPQLIPWATRLVELAEAAPRRFIHVPPPRLEALQGNILEKYLATNEAGGEQVLTHGCLVMLQFATAQAGRAFLARFASKVTTHGAPSTGIRRNVGLTHAGLVTLGLSGAELAAFPTEFREGMALRAGMLGDVGPNHPDSWELPERNWPPLAEGEVADGVDLATVDAVVLLQALFAAAADDHRWTPDHPLYAEVASLHDSVGQRGVDILHVQPLRHYETGHFGMVGGLSQPHARIRENDSSRDAVALGELVLGYPNERSELTSIPEPLARNSSFLVVRKHAQDIAAFAEATAGNAEVVAKLLGRSPDGRPLIGAGDNEFDYDDDTDGATCPRFAHVRRANPRSQSGAHASGSPRILRRGMSYGARDEAPAGERGLVFMAYCASIADQYELIQRWVNAGNGTNGVSAHPDVVGGVWTDHDRALPFRDMGGRERRVHAPSRPTAPLRWGLYLFVPSIDAMRHLSTSSEGSGPRAASGEAPRVVAELLALGANVPGETASEATERRARLATEWKRILEDGDRREDAAAIWQYVRERGGALRTPYGVLVGSSASVRRVLADFETFSVCEYHRRMHVSFGGHYLGLDPARGPTGKYAALASLPNAYLSSIDYESTFGLARRLTHQWFDALRAHAVKVADLQALARRVVNRVSREWFGPESGPWFGEEDDPVFDSAQPAGAEARSPAARCPHDFRQISQYVFLPNPTGTLRDVAVARGQAVLQLADAIVRRGKGRRGRLLEYLDERGFREDLRSALVGSINGFCAPTSGSLLGVIDRWLETRELWRWKQWYTAAGDEGGRRRQSTTALGEHNLLLQAMLRALMLRTVPDLLHRTTVAPGAMLPPDVELESNERVVVSLASAVADTAVAQRYAWTLLFGGDREDPAGRYPPHACPGQKMALGTIMGTITALLEQKNMRRRARLVVSFEWAVSQRSAPVSSRRACAAPGRRLAHGGPATRTSDAPAPSSFGAGACLGAGLHGRVESSPRQGSGMP